MLSNENPTPSTETVDKYNFDIARMKATQLGTALILGEHNPDFREREAANPAHPGATRVRRIDLERSCTLSRVDVDQECKDHNSRASSLGHPELFAHLWGEQR